MRELLEQQLKERRAGKDKAWNEYQANHGAIQQLEWLIAQLPSEDSVDGVEPSQG